MIVSLKWLLDYVDTSLSVQELADRLTMIGLEIEDYRPLYPHLEHVETALVEAVRPHPRADRLSLCEVSNGSGRFNVVCGAPNVRQGQIVALALPGAELEGGARIEEAVIRGEKSYGMICSQRELGLGEDAGGIWVLPSETPVGSPLAKALDIEDTIVDVSITPNRGDCLSILGIAREVAAICGTRVRYPETSCRESNVPAESLASVRIEDPVRCPRYAARVIEGIRIGPSPAWLKSRLEAVGLRSINNVVDVTNFVLMECGQPLHAFDFDLLREHRIVVRRAEEGERFTTLDGTGRRLYADTLLICDGKGPVAIAGIMGGLNSEITGQTTRVLIESAYFQPQSIRRSSRKLALRTESSYRFERGVDPEGVIRAVDRAARLMLEVGGGRLAAGRIDVYPQRIASPDLTLRVDRVNKFLGTAISSPEMAKVLRSIEMEVREVNANRLDVTPPSFRADVTREVDLAEEIARLAGYDRIPVAFPNVRMEAASFDPHLKMRQEIKEFLEGAGFFEVLNYSFISLDSLQKLKFSQGDRRLNPVPIRNPLSEEQAVMRTSLVPGLLQTARYNFDHRNDDLRVFELSKVFLPLEGEVLPEEIHHVAGLLAGKRNPHTLYGGEDEVDYTDVKGVVEGIVELFNIAGIRFTDEALPQYLDRGCASSVLLGDQHLGVLGRLNEEVRNAFELKKPIYLFVLDFEQLYQVRTVQPFFRSLPKFPFVTRDMAIVVGENLPARQPLDFIWAQDESLLEQVDIFDIYKSPQLGPGKKSVGYRLIYRSGDRSLTDEEVNDIHDRIVKRVLDAFDASLR